MPHEKKKKKKTRAECQSFSFLFHDIKLGVLFSTKLTKTRHGCLVYCCHYRCVVVVTGRSWWEEESSVVGDVNGRWIQGPLNWLQWTLRFSWWVHSCLQSDCVPWADMNYGQSFAHRTSWVTNEFIYSMLVKCTVASWCGEQKWI